MSKYKIGDLVRFKEDKLEVVSDKLMRMSLDVSDALGKVTGSVDMGPEGISYFVDIEFKSIGMTLNVKLKEDQLLTPLGYLNKKIFDAVKKGKGATAPDCRIATHLQDIVFCPGRVPSKSLWPSLKETMDNIEDIIKKWQENPERYKIYVDAVAPKGNPLPLHSEKMPTQKCVRLLESFVAEREKVKSGRRFERCLRDSVVDEALARAIELLKEKG